MKTDTTGLATEIKNQRAIHSLTQEGLAETANVNIRTIQRAEKGIKIGQYTLRRILEALNLDVLSTMRRFTSEEIEEPENCSNSEPREFNPDRWYAEFLLRKAKCKLWEVEISEETDRIKSRMDESDDNAEIAELEAQFEELSNAYIACQDALEEISNEEMAIDAFDWAAWEEHLEMEAAARERKVEEREIAERMEFFGCEPLNPVQ